MNVLRNSPNIWISLRVTFSNLIAFTVINKYGKTAVVQIWTLFGRVYHVSCWRVLWNGTFLTFIWPRLWESVVSEIHKLWVSSFFWKCSKLNIGIKTAEKIEKKSFVYIDKCVWIVYVEYSLSKTEYLS